MYVILHKIIYKDPSSHHLLIGMLSKADVFAVKNSVVFMGHECILLKNTNALCSDVGVKLKSSYPFRDYIANGSF